MRSKNQSLTPAILFQTRFFRWGFTCLILFATAARFSARAATAEKPAKVIVRVGHFPNLTHAQAVIAHGLSRAGKGWFEERLGTNVEVQWLVYNAGPSAMEGIFAGSLDLSYVGPNPAVNAYLRARGDEIRIVAGVCSGGAALVVRNGSGITNDASFKGKKVATPQLGNTQDVAARSWLLSKGFHVTLTGRDVSVIPTSNADQLALFERGTLDAAWTVEPWVTRLSAEAGGKVYLEESTLWPGTGGKYVTTHLVSAVKFLQQKGDILKKWIAAEVELTDWINQHPEEAKKSLNDEIKKETTGSLSAETLDSAWKRIEITYDPIRASLIKSANDAAQLGLLSTAAKPDLSRIYDLTLLNQVLREKGRPEIKP